MKILRSWKKRAQRNRKIRVQIGGLIEEKTDNLCNFCKRDWGLRGESIENIEQVFINFLKKNNKPINSVVWKVEDWQSYFKYNAKIRTLCFYCSEEIMNRYYNIFF